MGALTFAKAWRITHSWSDELVEIPTDQIIDERLVVSSALFGIGWRLAGFCPGLALVALGSASIRAAIFVAARLVGTVVHDKASAVR